MRLKGKDFWTALLIVTILVVANFALEVLVDAGLMAAP